MHALSFLLIFLQPWHLWSSLLFPSSQHHIKKPRTTMPRLLLSRSPNPGKSLSSYINKRPHTAHANNTNLSTGYNNNKKKKKLRPYDLSFFLLITLFPGVTLFSGAEPRLCSWKPHTAKVRPKNNEKPLSLLMRNNLRLIFQPQLNTYLWKSSQVERRKVFASSYQSWLSQWRGQLMFFFFFSNKR